MLAKKKTIDFGYAHLFSSMCNHIGIQNAVVKGFGRIDSTQIQKPNHTWVAFKLHNKWYIADPSCDSDIYHTGYKTEQKSRYVYLMGDPKIFLTLHFPIDPLWQLRPSIISLKDWNAFTFNSNTGDIAFNYIDSLKNYDNIAIEKNFLASLNRVIQNKELAYIAHYEYCSFFSQLLDEEIAKYLNINRQLNSGNKNIEEMARKLLPRKKELFDRLLRIESYVTKFNYHGQKLSEVQYPSKFNSIIAGTISYSKEETNRINHFLVYERNSLKETIKELEPYQKKTASKK
ncbi:transglutaminase domain-containing protein [Emticicia agri]|uniref:transglutaminase domain-containing protein n=1 Tax=Emticicia agri TaxID=2492393 RepID=UPI0021D293D2|nr:transglutaminase domain-containing protein [Emticicia agri]